MITTSIGIENLCVPCHAFCRYCLLSSCGKATGVDYNRGKRFAERFLEEIKEKRPELKSYYYIGYCMDDANLLDYISFSRKHNAPSSSFLQLNGLRIRSKKETTEFIQKIRYAGIESVDLTFYGTKEYHDRFAGRVGDFDFLLELLSTANEAGLHAFISIPVTKENIGQTECLLNILDGFNVNKASIFLPHTKGRGRSMASLRLTSDDLETVCPRVKEQLTGCRTEGEILCDPEFEKPQKRSLVISLHPDNIDELESLEAETILVRLESLDDNYYAAIPSVEELAWRYGEPDGKHLYRRFRDLHLEWQQRFLNDSGLKIWDINDESHHFSVRY